MNPHFAALVMGIATQATAALEGQAPPGITGADIGQLRSAARSMIDTLAMLEEKTRGNLGAEESRLLTDALTTLRFRFVQTEGRTH
jgi:hypothetical protein